MLLFIGVLLVWLIKSTPRTAFEPTEVAQSSTESGQTVKEHTDLTASHTDMARASNKEWLLALSSVVFGMGLMIFIRTDFWPCLASGAGITCFP
jgi:hypothetical protein